MLIMVTMVDYLDYVSQSNEDKRSTSPHKNYEQKADPDGICKCSRISGIFPKD